jgi:integrase
MDLWIRVRMSLAQQGGSAGPDAARWRAARALLLMMGDTGLRIAEASAATREALQWLPAEDGVPATWWLRVVGKGRKERFVPVSDEGVAALRAHWRDRGLDFDADGTPPSPAGTPWPLIAPLVIPATPRARAKFGAPDHDGSGATPVRPAGGGYSVRGARGLTQWALRELPAQLPALTEAERRQLARTSPHAFRHTCGTQSVAADVPLDVVQRLLGHASLQTTTVYVTAEQKRLRGEMARYHARLGRPLNVPPDGGSDA